MEAGPVLIDVEDPSSKLIDPVASDKIVKMVFKEKEEMKASLFESLTLQTALKTVPQDLGHQECLMSSSAADDSSSLSAFRREIERRVMEEIVAGKVKPMTSSGVASEEQDERLGKGDAKGKQIQNLPLRGRLPWRREKGALKDAAQSADELLDAPEAQPQTLQGMLDQSSLTDTQQQSTSVVETESISKELEELRNALSVVEPQLSVAKEGSARAEREDTQLQQLTQEMAAMVPLDIHNQVVKLQRESQVMARTRIAEVTAELKEKEVIIGAIKQEIMTERERLIDKVRELSGELCKRISAEEVEAAVNNAVSELETELGKALERAESMRLELETNENLLKQLQKEWGAERTSLRGELANVKEQLAELQQEDPIYGSCRKGE